MVDGVLIIVYEDVISEILLHLPPISILRFKLVSKQWYSLISNPNFLTSHSIYHCGRLPVMLIPKYSTKIEDSNFILLPHAHDEADEEEVHLQSSSSIVLHSNFLGHVCSVLNSRHTRNDSCFILHDSCNGLLLYTYMKYKKIDIKEWRKPIYHVCNPITKHFVQLPDIEEQVDKKLPPEIEFLSNSSNGFIAFDPSISLTYKVFMLIDSVIGMHCKLYVYSSETRSWKHLTHFTSNLVYLSKVVLLNGVAYWSYLMSTLEDVLLCIDVEKESSWFLPLPPKPTRGSTRRECLYFGECGGRVRLIEKFFYVKTFDGPRNLRFPCSFDIMELDHQQQQQQQEDGRRNCTWSVKYRVDINNVPIGYDHLIRMKSHLSVIHLHKTKNKGDRRGEEEEVLLLNIGDTMVIPFNVDSKTFGKEIMFPNSRQLQLEHYKCTYVLSYTMTLFPLL